MEPVSVSLESTGGDERVGGNPHVIRSPWFDIWESSNFNFKLGFPRAAIKYEWCPAAAATATKIIIRFNQLNNSSTCLYYTRLQRWTDILGRPSSVTSPPLPLNQPSVLVVHSRPSNLYLTVIDFQLNLC